MRQMINGPAEFSELEDFHLFENACHKAGFVG